MALSNELRKGSVFKVEGELFLVLKYEHHKPGKGGAIVRVKCRNIKKGTVIEKTFKSEEEVEDVTVETIQAQLLYQEGDNYIFMNTDNYEQYSVPEEIVGDAKKYLKNEMICELIMHDNEVIVVNPPMFVELVVTETDPGLRGDTVSGGSKPATVETGAVVQVPLFVSIGDKIKIDTRDDRYIERVK